MSTKLTYVMDLHHLNKIVLNAKKTVKNNQWAKENQHYQDKANGNLKCYYCGKPLKLNQRIHSQPIKNQYGINMTVQFHEDC